MKYRIKVVDPEMDIQRDNGGKIVREKALSFTKNRVLLPSGRIETADGTYVGEMFVHADAALAYLSGKMYKAMRDVAMIAAYSWDDEQKVKDAIKDMVVVIDEVERVG